MMLPERFAACVMLLAIDNDFSAKQPAEWPGFIDYAWVENKLKPLSEDEIETLCTGEQTDQEALIKKHDLVLVSGLLGMMFDDELHQYFFNVPEPFKS